MTGVQTCALPISYVYGSANTWSDRATYVTFSNSSPVAVTLPQAGTTGFDQNYVSKACNIGAGTATITPNSTSTISYTSGATYTSAASSMALTTGQCANISSDGANYFANIPGGALTSVGMTVNSTSPSGIFTVTGSPITTSGTLNINLAGTSGGIPYFSSGTVLSSSGALTGIVRGGSPPTAAELSADVTTSGSNAATVVQIEGGAIPASSFLVGTNSSKQLIAAQPNVVNAQTATYQVLAADFTGSKTISVASGTFNITLVDTATQPATGKSIDVINYGSGVVTIVRSGQNLNGGTTSISIGAGSQQAPNGAHIVSDGTNYDVQPWIGTGGAGGGTVTSIAFSAPLTGGTITGAGTVGFPTAVTSSGGGPITATAPVTASAAGVVAISGVTGLQGNGALLQLATGSPSTNALLKDDANGNSIASTSLADLGAGSL